LGEHPLAFELMQFNPAYLIMELPRRAILDNAAPTGREWLTLAVWGIVALIVGFRFFLGRENEYGHGWGRGLHHRRASAKETYVAPATAAGNISEGTVTVNVEHVHVRYRVYEDVKQTLRAIVASAGRRRRFREIHAISDVSLKAHAGEVVGVIGPNGSGKTTLMQGIAGLLPVNEGAVYARVTPMMLGVGAVLNRSLSGRRNILLGGLALGLTKQQVLSREQEIIDFSGIGDAIDRPMKTYSSGMSARLQFAISAAVRPEILIIDEALSVGDREFRQKSSKRIEELRQTAGTVFLVTHSMGTIRESCTRVIWLKNGKIEMDGDPEEVIAAYEGSSVRKEQRLKRTKRKAERALKQLAELDEEEVAAVVDSTGADPDSRSA
jgi:teichoic acid transport system ATP-binding protein